MDALLLLTYLGIGFIGGFSAGLFGIGGGAIKVPLLALTGMPLVNAFAVNMFAIPLSSASAAYFQRKNIVFSKLKPFVFGAVFAIAIATFFVGLVSDIFLVWLFFFAAIITVIGLYLQQLNNHLYGLLKPTAKNLFFSAFLTNLVVGLRGGSGGSLFAPVIKMLHFEMHHAIATSLFASACSALVALSIYLFRGDVLFLPAIIVAIGGLLGSYLGSSLSLRSDQQYLRAALAVIVFVLACSVVYTAYF